MASTATVKRALAALAAGHGFDSTDDAEPPPPETVVSTAEHAVERLDTAAAFVANGGEDRLRAAVARAESEAHPDVVRRGQRVLATLARFRAAAAEGVEDADEGASNSSDDSPASTAADEPRETVKRAGGQRPDR